MVRILALSHYFKGKSTEYSHYSHGQSERTAYNFPNSYAIICGKPHCAVLNYLWPVAPYRSIRDGKTRLNHAELHRTGRSYCAPYYKIAESAESTEMQKAQKAQKGKFAERPESAERRRKGLFGEIRPKNRCKSRRLNRWLSWPVRAAPAFTHLLTICERVQIVNMQ